MLFKIEFQLSLFSIFNFNIIYKFFTFLVCMECSVAAEGCRTKVNLISSHGLEKVFEAISCLEKLLLLVVNYQLVGKVEF